MICVYDKGNENYAGNGNVILQPLECRHTQVAAGKYDLSMTVPIDAEGKWKHLIPENAIIRAPIQEETIENAYSGLDVDLYQTTESAALRSGPNEPTRINYSLWVAGNTYSVGARVSVQRTDHRNYQCIEFDPSSGYVMVDPYNSPWWTPIADMTSGDPALVTLKSGASLYYVSGPTNGWYKMSTTYGLEGYIKQSQVVYVRHLTPEETQPRRITTQLFRVKVVNIETKQRRVTVTAEHVSYDLAGILVKDAKMSQMSPATALAWIEQSFMIDYRGTIATNMNAVSDGTYTGEINGKNAIYALLDPDKGVVASFGAMYRRDNWDVFMMRKLSEDRGFRIRYRKNMIGVSWNVKSENLINRVVPVAKDENGEDLYLDGTEWVDSPLIAQQPVIRMERIKVNGQIGKDDGTESGTTWTAETLRAEMRKQAEARFSVDKVDQTVHEVTVDFEMLGDTAEYKELHDLQKALMYDTVIAINEEIDLSVSMEVTEIEYDCIRQKVKALKLANVTAYGNRSVSGFNVFNNSITGDKLTDDAGDELTERAVDIAVDEAGDYTDQKAAQTLKSSKDYVGSTHGYADFESYIKWWVDNH